MLSIYIYKENTIPGWGHLLRKSIFQFDTIFTHKITPKQTYIPTTPEKTFLDSNLKALPLLISSVNKLHINKPKTTNSFQCHAEIYATKDKGLSTVYSTY